MTPPGERPRVLVVGAGAAGLAAAWELERAGVGVSVFESERRAGGRLRRERLDGLEFEPWPAFTPSAAPQLTALRDEWPGEPGVVGHELESFALSGRRGMRRRSLHTRASVHPFFLRWARLARAQSIAGWLGSEPDPAHPSRHARLDDRSVREHCALYLGRNAHDELFAPLLALLFGVRGAATTRQLPLMWMDAAANLRLRWWERLGEAPGELSRAIGVHTGRAVRALQPGGRGAWLDDGSLVDADAVVVAAGPRAVPGLAPDLTHVEREFFEGCETLSGLRVAVSAERGARPPERLCWSPDGGAGDLAGILDVTPTEAGPEPERRLLLLAVRPERVERLSERSDERIAEDLCAQARRLVPALGQAVREASVLRESGLPAFPVGHFRRVGLAEREASRRPERRVYFCGDYWVGPHVEAALASGRRAALKALDALGLASA